MLKSSTPFDRITLTAVAAGCIAAVGMAYGLQLSRGVEPCTLCILARYGLLVAALLALMTTQLASRFRTLGRVLITGSLLATAGAACRQLWVIAHPSAACGRDALAQFLNELTPAAIWPRMFEANGLCGDVLEPILGFSFPGLALIAALGLISLVWAPLLLRERHLKAPEVV